MEKNLDYYMSLEYPLTLVRDDSEGSISYVAYYPDLPGCITAGDTIDEAVRNSEDAKENWLMAAIEDGVKIKEPSDEYSGNIKLRLPKSLHKRIADNARREGVSMNQYCVYALTQAVK